MSTDEFDSLPCGATVQWIRDDERDTGTIAHDGQDRYIKWPDGQRTDPTDEWAMRHIYQGSQT